MDSVTCPACRSNRIESLGKKHALYPVAFLNAGLLIASLHQGQLPSRFRCDACGWFFSRRTGLARFNLVLLVIILCWLIPAVLMMLVALLM